MGLIDLDWFEREISRPGDAWEQPDSELLFLDREDTIEFVSCGSPQDYASELMGRVLDGPVGAFVSATLTHDDSLTFGAANDAGPWTAAAVSEALELMVRGADAGAFARPLDAVSSVRGLAAPAFLRPADAASAARELENAAFLQLADQDVAARDEAFDAAFTEVLDASRGLEASHSPSALEMKMAALLFG